MFALVKTETVTNPQTQTTSDVQVISLFTPYTVWKDKHGTQHSPDILLSMTADQKQDAGIYDVAYGNRPDDRFYSVVQESVTFDETEKIVKVTYTSDPKQLDDDGDVKGLKSQWIANFKDTANKLLAQSDWMLVRKIERNVDVPAATATYRAAVVAESNRLATAIGKVKTVPKLIEAIESANWPSAE